MHPDDVQAMEQVLPKGAVLHPLLQMLMGGGDDAHVHLHGVVAADPVELPLGNHPQQADLAVGGHVADFVQKQGAAVGLFEAADPSAGSAGEGAFFVAEQFGFDQFIGDGGDVQGHEGLLGAGAVPVQRIGHQLLAGAGGTVDQHRDVGGGQPADGAKNLLHGRRLAENLLVRGGRFGAALRLALSPGQRPLDHGHRLIDVEWLGQVFKGAPMVGGDGAVEVGVRGHDDHRQAGLLVLQRVEKFEPVHTRHADVAEHRHRALPGGQGLVGTGEGGVGDARPGHGLFEHPTD